MSRKDKDVQSAKGGGHNHEEVAGEYGAGMIVEEVAHDWVERHLGFSGS